VSIEADVIDGPAIDSDGANTFCSDRRALTQACMETVKNHRQVPVQAIRSFDGMIGKAVDKFDCRNVILPAKQRDTATLCAEIDGDKRPAVFDA